MRTRYGRAAKARIWVAAAALALAFGTAACGGNTSAQPQAGPQTVKVGQESVTVVRREPIAIGPLVSGALRAEREATVRAEVGGSILQVAVEEGQAVRAGDLVARIEARALEDVYSSAQSSVRSAEQALKVAEREADRTATLVKGGALAERDLDMARNAVSAAQAQLADAVARLASAQKQFGDTVIRAPITGVVSRRPVNRGDVVTPGTEVATIIDPSSMRLEAGVPSDALASLRVGAPVEFRVRGYGEQRFTGRIQRISPAADPVTRQVTIFVGIPNTGGRLVAGLFAEGRVTTETRQVLVVPSTAVETTDVRPWVLRVRDGKAERVSVELGVRDERSERVELVSGVSEGDVLLTGAAHAVTPGTPVQIVESGRAEEAIGSRAPRAGA
jgi:RND family efflux transporter MFP subunit